MNNIIITVVLLLLAVVAGFVCLYLDSVRRKSDFNVKKALQDSALSVLERAIYTAVVATNEEFTKLYKGTDEWTDERKAEAREIAFNKVLTALNVDTYDVLKEDIGDITTYIQDRILATVNDINAQTSWR